MPKFGQASKDNLAKAHPDLQLLFNEVIKEVDCKILDSVRDKAAQELAFNKGNSKAHFGQSPHNYYPSFSVDVVPWPLDWNDLQSFRNLAKVVKAKIKALGLEIDWGGDWKSFKDYPHWEIRNWKAKKAQAKPYTAAVAKSIVVPAKPPALPIPATTLPERVKPKPLFAFPNIFGKKETIVSDIEKPDWASSLTRSTLFNYIVAFAGGAVAAKLGLDPELFKEGVPDVVEAIGAIIGAVSAILVALRGMKAAATPKAVVDGTVVKLSEMPEADQLAVAKIVAKNK